MASGRGPECNRAIINASLAIDVSTSTIPARHVFSLLKGRKTIEEERRGTCLIGLCSSGPAYSVTHRITDYESDANALTRKTDWGSTCLRRRPTAYQLAV